MTAQHQRRESRDNRSSRFQASGALPHILLEHPAITAPVDQAFILRRLVGDWRVSRPAAQPRAAIRCSLYCDLSALRITASPERLLKRSVVHEIAKRAVVRATTKVRKG